MILIDSSAWIEFLRDTGSPTASTVETLLDDDIATCDPIRMEVLAGARSERHLGQLHGLLARATVLPTQPSDYDRAAQLYRSCRAGGETVRRLVDCLTAAVAIREGLPVLHADADFDALSRHSELRIS